MPMVTPKRPEDYLPPGINLEPWAADKIDVAPTYPYSHGFKHMWDRGIQPRFPFGWGLSYTSFQHSGLSAELNLQNARILVRTEVDKACAKRDAAKAKVTKYQLKVDAKSGKSGKNSKKAPPVQKLKRVPLEHGKCRACQQYARMKAGLITKVSAEHSCAKRRKLKQEASESESD
ncbi:bglB [Symbiodinium sp. CCMP2592]|nr:bglB [Symbiodinium sp. CCMP2592]